MSYADEQQKLKNLLDTGALSQDEYDEQMKILDANNNVSDNATDTQNEETQQTVEQGQNMNQSPAQGQPAQGQPSQMQQNQQPNQGSYQAPPQGQPAQGQQYQGQPGQQYNQGSYQAPPQGQPNQGQQYQGQPGQQNYQGTYQGSYQAPPQGQPGQQYDQGQYNQNPQQPYQQQFQQPSIQKSKMAAGLLGIFLGSLGIHNFYLGYMGKAIAQLLLTLIGWIIIIGPIAAGIWGLIEGILILTGSIAVDAKGIPMKD